MKNSTVNRNCGSCKHSKIENDICICNTLGSIEVCQGDYCQAHTYSTDAKDLMNSLKNV